MPTDRLACFPLDPGPYRPLHDPARSILGGWLVTSYFGGRIDPLTGRPGNHGGMDLAFGGCAGQPMRAPIPGRVAQGWDKSGGGNWTTLYGDDGSRWGFGHASSFAPGVNGTHVAAGTVLAFVGTTGGSTGPHDHIAYAPTGGAYADPFNLLNECSAAGRYAGQPVPPDPPEDDVTPEDIEAIAVQTAALLNEQNSFVAHGVDGAIYRIGGYGPGKVHLTSPDQVDTVVASGVPDRGTLDARILDSYATALDDVTAVEQTALTLSDGDLARIATTVADEQARRLAG